MQVGKRTRIDRHSLLIERPVPQPERCGCAPGGVGGRRVHPTQRSGTGTVQGLARRKQHQQPPEFSHLFRGQLGAQQPGTRGRKEQPRKAGTRRRQPAHRLRVGRRRRGVEQRVMRGRRGARPSVCCCGGGALPWAQRGCGYAPSAQGEREGESLCVAGRPRLEETGGDKQAGRDRDRGRGASHACCPSKPGTHTQDLFNCISSRAKY